LARDWTRRLIFKKGAKTIAFEPFSRKQHGDRSGSGGPRRIATARERKSGKASARGTGKLKLDDKRCERSNAASKKRRLSCYRNAPFSKHKTPHTLPPVPSSVAKSAEVRSRSSRFRGEIEVGRRKEEEERDRSKEPRKAFPISCFQTSSSV
jgi:hypothetical protein